MGLITIGLKQVLVGTAAPNGVMPATSTMKKIGKVYQDTAKFQQDEPEVMEHFEESNPIPVVRKVKSKPPTFNFTIMDPDIDTLVNYLGGTKTAKSGATKTTWGWNGNETVPDRSIYLETEQGLCFSLPNASISAKMNAELSAKGLFGLEMTVTALAVAEGKKSLLAHDPNEA